MMIPLLTRPLAIGALETSLNSLLFRDRCMYPACARLIGKRLEIVVQELNTPLLIVFNENKVDIIASQGDVADCTVRLRLAVLPQLRDRRQLMPLIRSGELEVTGDTQLLQNVAILLDLTEWDPAEWLAPYLGDIVAESLCQSVKKGVQIAHRQANRQQQYLAQIVTEEWKLAPSQLQMAWLSEEIEVISRQTQQLSERLHILEAAHNDPQ